MTKHVLISLNQLFDVCFEYSEDKSFKGINYAEDRVTKWFSDREAVIIATYTTKPGYEELEAISWPKDSIT